MEADYILLNRRIIEWGWYKNQNTKDVFIHLLLIANWKDSVFMGTPIPRGTAVVGIFSLAESLGLTPQTIRTSLSHLKSTNEITIKSTNRFSLITIVNYNKYQISNNQTNNQTNKQLTNNQQTTNNNRIREEGNNVIKFIIPTLEEIKKEIQEKSYNVDAEKFRAFYESNGWRVGKNPMKSWKACLITWNKTSFEPKREIKLPKNIL